MKNRTHIVNDMLRRALEAQEELGLGEIIVSGSDSGSRTPPPSPMATAEGEPANLDLLASMEPNPAEPEYSSLDHHYQEVCDCQLCPLGQTRTKFVYGVGNPDADLLFIGEAPGRDEDLQGEPFVGRAGQLLDKILAAMELSRRDVYIANILKCRPPNNRDPQPDEMEKCFPYLKEQIRLIRPRIICALGRISGQALLNTKAPLGRLRRQWHRYEGIPMIVTYHPAALLRFQQYKKDTWEDMQMILARMKEMT